MQKIDSVGDSRIHGLKIIKQINPSIKTMYIRPPAINEIADIIAYSDISLNSSISTVNELNREAVKQKKNHSIIIMIEMGDLREGIIREDLMEFYKNLLDLSNIEVIGIGTNLGCLSDSEPTYEKLKQLSSAKSLLEDTFGKKLDFVSGGSSITLPLTEKNNIPASINHFRVGEAVFMGTSPLNNKQFLDLHTDVFDCYGYIIEIEKKGCHSHRHEIATVKAILDFGKLDVSGAEILPGDTSTTLVGMTSDMSIYDLGNNKEEDGRARYHVGDKFYFSTNYMSIAQLLHSKFVNKIIY
ncbi:MAG: alanine/ornithine racemase family PLP-dependent enzyme [bacterium]|nr:alanine/ornithine racemase family PLP-dependent enzyme [bacterium]